MKTITSTAAAVALMMACAGPAAAASFASPETSIDQEVLLMEQAGYSSIRMYRGSGETLIQGYKDDHQLTTVVSDEGKRVVAEVLTGGSLTEPLEIAIAMGEQGLVTDVTPFGR